MKCEEEGCEETENLTECTIYSPDNSYNQDKCKDCEHKLKAIVGKCNEYCEKDNITIYYYCSEHCYKNGFCYICGKFWGGIESFDFNNPSQLCENCLDQLKTELGEYDDEQYAYGEDYCY